MPAATRRRQAAITESYSVDKRICAHQAKFGGNAEIDLSPPRRSVRSTRSIRYTSYSDSDDDEQEEEQYDEEEYYEEQEEQYEEIESDVEETLRPLIKTTAVVSRIIESASGKIFKNMATEIHQHIADYLPSDYDVASYALACKTTGAAITPSVWRKRFMRTFDFDDNLSTADMLMKYKYRRLVSRQWTCFDLGQFAGASSREIKSVQATNQEHCLAMLRSLIIESDARKVYDDNGTLVIDGLNLEFIQDMITGRHGMSYTDIVDAVFCTSYDQDIAKSLGSIMNESDPEHALYGVQLCLAIFSLHPKYCNLKVSHFDISQHQAYSAPSSQPLFLGKYKQSINSRCLLHIVNFFKYHFKSEGEGLLAHNYLDLDTDQHPMPWVGKIKAGTQPLGAHWKGAYMYLDQNTLLSCRQWRPSSSGVHTDSLDGGETFQDMAFFFDDEQHNNDKWPKQWEDILHSDPFMELNTTHASSRRSSPQTSRTKNEPQPQRPEIRQFWGTTRGAKQGHFFGRLHALVPQAGIHGYQRLTMMQFYTKVENGQHVYDPNQVWAYEGCVLPGGRIIVGRWWDAVAELDNPNINSGPFIWWNVDRSGATKPIEKTEAFDFLDSFQDSEIGVF